jgi:hypothetical protein
MKRFVFSLLLVLLTVTMAAPAWSQGPVDPVLKNEADALFDRGRYAEAYDLYKRLYTQTANPALLYNQARALEAMGEYPEALDQLEAFSRAAPADVRAKVPKLEELTNELRGRTTSIHVTTNVATARLYVRGRDLGPIERERHVRARSGEASIRVEADGYAPYAKEMTLPGGAVVDVDAQLKPARPAEGGGAGTSTNNDTPLTSKWWFWTAIGVVAVAGITVTILAVTIEKSPDQGTFSPSPIRVKGFSF